MIYIGLGGNVGDVVASFRAARAELGAVRSAPLYRSAPIGPDQPDFLNSALALADAWEPRPLLAKLQGIEHARGRVRGARWGPRTLDLDILWWDGREVHEDGLEIPHPRLLERRFAVLPLIALGLPFEDALDQAVVEIAASW